MKPKIRFITPYLFGIAWKKTWVCESREAAEFGNSPLEAYNNWLEKMPKTSIGKWWARLLK